MTHDEFQDDLKKALGGDLDAMVKVALAYRAGDGTEPSREKYFEWLQKAAEDEFPTAMYYLAISYKDGDYTSVDFKKYFEWIRRAAEATPPDREAMFNVALAYDAGIGTAPDQNKYFEWIEKMAQRGAPGAMLSVALAYRDGKGTVKNDQEFFKWARKSVDAAWTDYKKHRASTPDKTSDWASEDLPRATFTLAQAHRQGIGTHKRLDYAFKWLRRSAIAALRAIKMPDRPAELDVARLADPVLELALAYKEGTGCPRAPNRYLWWVRQAANAGLPGAMRELAMAYLDGPAVPRSEKEYFGWLQKAAEKDDPEAMYRLGCKFASNSDPLRGSFRVQS
jgi:TPR repeat protein